MPSKAILFDQDGTLLDSAPGIKKSAQETLAKMGYPVPAYSSLDYFIGPPLSDCFRLSKVEEKRIPEAMRIYRGIYEKGRKYEAMVYPLVVEGLSELKEKGFRLFVCTSKKESLAQDTLAHFGLSEYFEGIFGAASDGKGARKGEIIRRCLASIKGEKNALMIGDTPLDAQGAKENKIPSAIVNFGYGDPKKIQEEKPVAIIGSFLEIPSVFDAIYPEE